MQIPPALVLGCNTPHGIGVLSDWIEEQTGQAPDFSVTAWSDKQQFHWTEVLSGDASDEGYGNKTGDGFGNGVKNCYGYGSDESRGAGDGYCWGQAYGNGDGAGWGRGYGSLDGNGGGK